MTRNPIGIALLAALLLVGGRTAAAQQAAGVAAPADAAGRLAAWPQRFTLDSAVDQQPLSVVFTDALGISREVADAAEFVVGDPALVAVADAVARPLAEGETWIEVRHAGHAARIAVVVRDAHSVPQVSFRNDVIPVLTRAGCNAGPCHGSKDGKNGFGLSLFGYDPRSDHLALTREARGRRIDRADPTASLVLTKPTGAVTHKGGRRLEAGGDLYARLRDWIAEGAADDRRSAPALTGVRVEPADLVLAGAGAEARVLVTATYADGSTRDVTRLAILSSSSDSTVSVDAAGELTAGARGEAYVMARFGSFAEVAQVIVLPDDAPYAGHAIDAANEVDRFVFDKLRRMRLLPAPRCDDRTFVRRVHVDLLGRLPTPAEVEAFVADGGADKRAALVDRLLGDPAFATTFAAMWEEVLRIEDDQLRDKGVVLYTRWLRESIRDGVPFDRIVRELLTATGSHFEVPQAGYYVVSRDVRVLAENAAQTFLGIRVQCAQCHNHPFERWTMDDYYGFAAFFGQLGRKTGEHPREQVIFDANRGDVRNVRDGSVAAPRFLGGEEPEIARRVDRRAVLAEWLTAPDNPWFAANVANRIWARLFGRGIVDPVDDVRVSNPPSHPALHRWLGEQLAASGFDVRTLIRTICASHAYQAAQHADGAPAATLAGREPRRMAAEQLLDAIGQVTGVPTKLRGVPLGASAREVIGPDGGNRFLGLFGRPERETVCACERTAEPTLAQVLHLINGPTVEAKVRADDGVIARSLAAGLAPAALLDEIFLRAYARPARPDERAALLADLEAAESPRGFFEDLLWAVLNSREFLFQR